MNSGCLKSLSDQVKGEINNAKRSREDRFKAQKDVEVKLEKLKDGAFIKETDKAISRHVKNISTQVKSCLQQDEVRSAFCTWEEKDLPQIDDSQRGKVLSNGSKKFYRPWKRGNSYFRRLTLTLSRDFVKASLNLRKTYETSIRSLLANLRTKYYCNLKTVLPWTQELRNSFS